MNHSFNVEVAKEVGMKAAVIFTFIEYYVLHNEGYEPATYDGKVWTRYSLQQFKNEYPYLTEKEIRNAIKTLEDNHYVESCDSLNTTPYDHTKWYTLGENAPSNRNDRFDMPDGADHEAPRGRQYIYNNQSSNYKDLNKDSNNSIVDSNEPTAEKTVKRNDKKEAQTMFLRCWKLYPKKEGKGQVSDSKKLKLFHEVGEEQFCRCIERYKRQRQLDGRYLMNGSTFFNSGYVDYLDENCGEKTLKKKEDDRYADYE